MKSKKKLFLITFFSLSVTMSLFYFNKYRSNENKLTDSHSGIGYNFSNFDKSKIASPIPLIQRPETKTEVVKDEKLVKTEDLEKRTGRLLPYKTKILNRYRRFLPKTAKIEMEYLGTITVTKPKGDEIRDLVLISTTFANGKFNSFRASVNPKTFRLENAFGSVSHGKKISFQMQNPDI